MNDNSGTGTCIVVVDTQGHAEAAMVPLSGAGVPKSSAATYTRSKPRRGSEQEVVPDHWKRARL
jgi:hypothetical protein